MSPWTIKVNYPSCVFCCIFFSLVLGLWLMLFCFSLLKTSSLFCVYSTLFSCWICSQLHACILRHFSPVQLSATPWTIACQAPLSTGFSRREYWSGLPCSQLHPVPNMCGGELGRSDDAFPGSVHTHLECGWWLAGDWKGGGEKREHFPICDPTSCLWRHSWDSSLGLQLLHMGLQLPTGWQVLDQGRSPSSLVAGSSSILSN